MVTLKQVYAVDVLLYELFSAGTFFWCRFGLGTWGPGPLEAGGSSSLNV